MNVLVIGGAGYIGSHVCRALISANFHPIIYDNMDQGRPFLTKWGKTIRGDLLDTCFLESVLRHLKPVGVIHLAAYHNVRESALDPEKYYTNNCMGTLSLLKAMTHAKISTLIFSSSASVYGKPNYTPIDEEHPKAPLSPYGRSKWFIEQMLVDFDQAHQIHSISLRYFNAAGADLDGEMGESHQPETHLIPLAILAALGERPPLTLYGDDHPTFDGTPIRDYVHVSDLAEAHVRALKHLLKNRRSLALNLGTGKGYSVKEVIKMIEHVLDCEVPYSISLKSPFDPPILIANPAKAIQLLGWKPRYSDLMTLIETAANWHKRCTLICR